MTEFKYCTGVDIIGQPIYVTHKIEEERCIYEKDTRSHRKGKVSKSCKRIRNRHAKII